MKDCNYIPDGKLQGDNKAMPNKGTSTGLGDSYGASTGEDSTNSMGSIKGGTKSDPMMDIHTNADKL